MEEFTLDAYGHLSYVVGFNSDSGGFIDTVEIVPQDEAGLYGGA